MTFNPWLLAAFVLLFAFIPTGIACFRGETADRLVALEHASVLVTLEMVLLAEAYQRTIFYDLPLTLSFLSFGGGMVFARFLQRWL